MLTMQINRQEYEWVEQFRPEKRLVTGRAYHAAKRVMDLGLTLLAMPFWLPLLTLLWVVIKLQDPSGPALFAQYRTGINGKRFKMYKFRTMVVNAEELKKTYAHLNELQWPDFKITNDPRITRLGKILRKTSLDELPQLFNVISGEMSLVGPRPTSFSAEQYQLWHTERLDVKPGLTGLWQIVGRGESEFDDRLRMDIAYMERRCLWLDFQILVRTGLAVFKQRGAK